MPFKDLLVNPALYYFHSISDVKFVMSQIDNRYNKSVFDIQLVHQF